MSGTSSPSGAEVSAAVIVVFVLVQLLQIGLKASVMFGLFVLGLTEDTM